jgi:DNA invertase Pin-like site-specific DNA recombinase
MSYSAYSDSKPHSVTEAVIYARVSSAKQVSKGDGLNSQITRCAEYAKHHGYTVVKEFKDDVSGSLRKRNGMSDLIAFLKSKKAKQYVIIIDDLSRLARDFEVYLSLKRELIKSGGILESPSIEFGEDADSHFMEHMMAVVAQHQREKNAEQAKNRMRARVLNGYWVYRAPSGFRYERVEGRGKMLVRHEPLATAIQTALEGYASGRFQNYYEVMQYFDSLPYFPRDGRGKIRFDNLERLVANPLYAGLIEHKRWDVPLRKAAHKGLINAATYDKILARLKERPIAPERKDFNEDFILRGAVKCAGCGWQLTAAWSSGRSKKYPYYKCCKKGCESYGKSVARDKVEGAVETMLVDIQPTPEVTQVAMLMFKRAWEQMCDKVDAYTKSSEKALKDCQTQIDSYLSRLVETENQTVANALEGKITQLERKKLLLSEKKALRPKKRRPFDESLRTAMNFLLNPRDCWVLGDAHTRRTMLRLAFGGGLSYDIKGGVRTAQIAKPFQLIQRLSSMGSGKNMPEFEMVGGNGFEPLTLSV